MRILLLAALISMVGAEAQAADPAVTWSYRSSESGTGQGGYAGAVKRRGPLGTLAGFLVKQEVLPPACDWEQRSQFTRRTQIKPTMRDDSRYSVTERAESCPASIKLKPSR